MRTYLQGETAAKLCTCLDGTLLLALRTTFGGSRKPPKWNNVSILLTNLANDLVRRMGGDPLTRHSPHKRLLNSPDAVDNDAGGV